MASDDPYVYDKAKYHARSIKEHKLPGEHAANHAVVFLRWLIERGLVSQEFENEAKEVLEKYRAGKASIHDVYEWEDCCLSSDMLSDEGNAFARHYFDFEQGLYPQDYCGTLAESAPTIFHVEYSEANYRKLLPTIDRRYKEWKSQASAGKPPQRRKRWPF
jgi:hypothetical protein